VGRQERSEVNAFTFPDPASLPTQPKRVILHWTAGSYQASEHDAQYYHGLIEFSPDGNAKIVAGVPIANNMLVVVGLHSFSDDYRDGYAAHTRGFNSYSVGFSLCGMFGAVDRENLGAYPIMPEQVTVLIGLCANASIVFGLEVSDDTFFTHYEAQSLHGVQQMGKWDIGWIPQEPTLSQDEVGPWLREQIKDRL